MHYICKGRGDTNADLFIFFSSFDQDMDPTSQKAVEEEVESHAPSAAATRGQGEPAPLAPVVPAQPLPTMFQQIAKFFIQMAGVMPPPPPPQQKSHLEKLRKFGAVNFVDKNEDDPMATKNWLD